MALASDLPGLAHFCLRLFPYNCFLTARIHCTVLYTTVVPLEDLCLLKLLGRINSDQLGL